MKSKMLFLQREQIFYSAAEVLGLSGQKILKRVSNAVQKKCAVSSIRR
jgi:hypothetical protein